MNMLLKGEKGSECMEISKIYADDSENLIKHG